MKKGCKSWYRYVEYRKCGKDGICPYCLEKMKGGLKKNGISKI